MTRSDRVLTMLSLVVLLTASMCFVFVAHAPAKDSLAPKSAGDRWLPCERWVLYHWNPIDMQRLYARTGIDETELFDWLRDDDNHTLSGLITKHDLDPEDVVTSSLAVDPGLPTAVRATLAERADRLLTQGHLAQHVFFHVFHSSAIRQHSREIFGMNPWDYSKARRLGFSAADMGRLKRGYSRRQTAARVLRVIGRYEKLGIVLGATSNAQADSFMDQTQRLVDSWIDMRYLKKRPRHGLPQTTRAAGKDRKGYSCKDFFGPGQALDGFSEQKEAVISVHGVPGFCPLELATRRILATERSSHASSSESR
jgi:hypothetical protein